METSDNPVERMLARMEYKSEDGDSIESILESLRSIQNHAPDEHVMHGFSSLVRQGMRLSPQQRISLRGAMDAVLRCAQAMEDSLGAITPEMEEYYQDTQNIAMSYCSQLSLLLTGQRVKSINDMKRDLMDSLERGGISPRELDPLTQPLGKAELPLGWEQPSLFSSDGEVESEFHSPESSSSISLEKGHREDGDENSVDEDGVGAGERGDGPGASL